MTILGKRGSGKTVLSNAIARLRPNVLSIDPLGDNEFGEEIAWEQLPDIGKPGRRRLKLFSAPSELSRDAASAQIFRFVLLAAENRKLPEPFTLYIDEADVFGSAYWNDASLSRLANHGRHWSVSFIVNTRRYASIPKDWTSQSELIIIGPSLDTIADGRVVAGLIGTQRLPAWEGLKKYQFIAKGLDGIRYMRYSGYDRDTGYIEYTHL